MNSAVADGLALGGRNLRLMSRRPASIAGAVIFPMLFTLMFFGVFRKVMDRAGIDYAQHILPAVVVQAMFFTGMSAAVLAAEDSAGGMHTRLRAMPVSRTAPFVGMLLAAMVRALISMTVLFPLGMILGFRFQRGFGSTVGFVLVALTFAAAACAGYLAMGLAVGRPESVQAMVMLPYFPLLLISTALSPAEFFPGWLQPFVRHQPVSRTCDALRALASAGSAAGRPVAAALAWLVPLFAVFTVAAGRAFGRPAASPSAGPR